MAGPVETGSKLFREDNLIVKTDRRINSFDPAVRGCSRETDGQWYVKIEASKDPWGFERVHQGFLALNVRFATRPRCSSGTDVRFQDIRGWGLYLSVPVRPLAAGSRAAS